MSYVPLETVSKCANIKHQASFSWHWIRTAHSGPHKLVKNCWGCCPMNDDYDQSHMMQITVILLLLLWSKTAVNSYSLSLVYKESCYDALKWPQVRIPIRPSPSYCLSSTWSLKLTCWVISHSSFIMLCKSQAIGLLSEIISVPKISIFTINGISHYNNKKTTT